MNRTEAHEGAGGAGVTPSVERRTVTVEEAARILGIGRNAAYDAAKRGELPTLRIGRRLVVPLARLEQMLAGDRNPDAAA